MQIACQKVGKNTQQDTNLYFQNILHRVAETRLPSANMPLWHSLSCLRRVTDACHNDAIQIARAGVRFSETGQLLRPGAVACRARRVSRRRDRDSPRQGESPSARLPMDWASHLRRASPDATPFCARQGTVGATRNPDATDSTEGKFDMSAGFAGSASQDDRRRRRLATDSNDDDAQSVFSGTALSNRPATIVFR